MSKIKLTDKSVCTGCTACCSICPTHCITMKEDNEGFLYPVLDEEKCIKCGKCEIVCPVTVSENERKPLRVYAAKNLDEKVCYKSSSGGIFTLLAEDAIHRGGVVFGVQFNESWEVVHEYTETIEGIEFLRGSKYIQSRIGEKTFNIIQRLLEAGRYVLFSGTPCQIKGLKSFLQHDYLNLLTIDVVCHGVPSPGVWRKYLDEICKKVRLTNNIDIQTVGIKNINFRDKRYGWNPVLTFSIDFSSEMKKEIIWFVEDSNHNTFMKGFLQDLYLRMSCYHCPVKLKGSSADITLADYWGIENVLPEFNDKKGISLVIVNTEKGRQVYNTLYKEDRETSYTDALAGNANIVKSAVYSKKREVFFEKWENVPIISLIDSLTRYPIQKHIKNIIIFLLCRVGILPIIKKALKKMGYK